MDDETRTSQGMRYIHGNRRSQGVIRQQRRPGSLVLSTVAIEGLFELFLLDHQVELAYRITPDGLHWHIKTGECPPGVWHTPGVGADTTNRVKSSLSLQGRENEAGPSQWAA